jgi:hypothetical protein
VREALAARPRVAAGSGGRSVEATPAAATIVFMKWRRENGAGDWVMAKRGDRGQES